MDIDDILSSVGARDTNESLAAQDLQELCRAWVNEKSAPELLMWPAGLMERVMERIKRQIEVVEEQSSAADPATSFRLIVVQTELERFKFLVRSFARIRTAKIDRYALHYLSDASARARLSPSELQYATSHQALLATHYNASFLSQFPVRLQRLDDTVGGISMVEKPDADGAVFVRALVDSPYPVQVEGTDISFEMQRGNVYVVRWSALKDRVLEGEAELI